MDAPDPLDLIDIDALLSDEERQIRGLARQWVADRILPDVDDWYEHGEFPARELAKELGQLGFLGMQLPDIGGLAAVAYGLVELELEAGDSGLRSFVSVTSALAMFAIHTFGSDEQKAEWLPRMQAGEAIGCFGLSEPDSGSDPGVHANVRQARRRRLDPVGHEDVDHERQRVRRGDRLGEHRRRDPRVRRAVRRAGVLGAGHPQEAVAAGERHLRAGDGRGPTAGRRDAPRRQGIARPTELSERGAVRDHLGRDGRGALVLRVSLDYSKTRIQFDRPIGSFQLDQKKLTDMSLELNKGTLLAYHLGRMKEAGRLLPQHVSVGKLNNTRAALEIARTSRGIHGANGITLEYPIMRHMTNLESVITYEGTEEVHTLVIGEALTGLRAFT